MGQIVERIITSRGAYAGTFMYETGRAPFDVQYHFYLPDDDHYENHTESQERMNLTMYTLVLDYQEWKGFKKGWIQNYQKEYSQLVRFVEEKCQGRVTAWINVASGGVEFESKDDAMLFKLSFG